MMVRCGLAVVHASATLGRGDGETDRQVRFTDAGWSQKDHTLAALDEAELVQALHLLPPEGRLKREIEVVELLDERQTAGSHRRLQTSVISELRLCGEQLLDGLGRGERPAIDALQDRVE